jgi:hypothetical protein
MPTSISFDHDLGAEMTGLDLAKWLVEEVLDGRLQFPPSFSINVHSANPAGRENIEYLMNNILREMRARGQE